MNLHDIKISAKDYWFLFYQGELLLKNNQNSGAVPLLYDPVLLQQEIGDIQCIGMLGEQKCYAASLRSNNIPEDFSLQALRQLSGYLQAEYVSMAYRAFHLHNWFKNSRFCGCCGSPMQLSSTELAMSCPNCGHLQFPRISPAIIVAIRRGRQLLLARSSRFPPNRYSVIAGFVEAGETLEDCVKREIKEEVGIEVTNIKYFGSQPWPFPDSLMLAFTADYSSGEIAIDNQEIIAADWFTVETLPDLPGGDSIARKLIDHFIADSK